DYLPTILDILNIPYPDRPIDGISLLGALKGENKVREKAIGFLYKQKISWVDNRYKLISVDNGQSFELYDLINDRAEKENIIQKVPEIAAIMKKDLYAWIDSVENSKKGMDYN
ncbi:N-acetylgalactosamine 6-sulfate sulfatase, partial [Bacteroidota bacterium]